MKLFEAGDARMTRISFAVTYSVSAVYAAVYIAICVWEVYSGGLEIFYMPYTIAFLASSIILIISIMLRLRIMALSLLAFSTILFISIIYSLYKSFLIFGNIGDINISGVFLISLALILVVASLASSTRMLQILKQEK